jgi:hypothetical protein
VTQRFDERAVLRFVELFVQRAHGFSGAAREELCMLAGQR